MGLNKLGVVEANKKYINGDFLAVDMVNSCIENINKYETKNAVLEVFEDAIKIANALDGRRQQGEKLGKLAGVVVLIKDNILLKGKKATASSKFLENFESIYTSTVVQKLLDEDAIILGRTNMDEFAMGGDGTTSIYGKTLNALDDELSPGGSSSGSGVAVALDMCNFALGTDTGDSVRLPSAYNGIVGIKPTYGLVSRNGVYAYASSLDQVGPMTKNVLDSAYVLEIIAGNDKFDTTSTTKQDFDFTSQIERGVNGKVIALEKTIIDKIKDGENYNEFVKIVEFLSQNGVEIKEIQVENLLNIPDIYQIVAFSEGSSNLSRYDGLKYTTQSAQATNAEEIYVKSRSEGFGKGVKRRIMLGNYILSKGDIYAKTMNLRQYIMDSFASQMQGVDCLVAPMTLTSAIKLGEKAPEFDGVLGEMANVLKIPAITIPYANDKNNLPLGLQILAKEEDEALIYQVANFIEKNYKGGKK